MCLGFVLSTQKVLRFAFSFDGPSATVPPMSLPYVKLFHPRVVRRELESLRFPDDLEERHARFVVPWVTRLRRGELDEVKEVSLQGAFLAGIFGGALGYRSMTDSADPEWSLVAEKTVSKTGKSADGALGFFSTHGESRVVAPIELKGAKQSLDVAQGRTLTPVQQAWEYANYSPGCRWIIVSNFREVRLYSRVRTPGEYESFRFGELENLEAFKRFYLFLAKERLLPSAPEGRSALDDMLVASNDAMAEITAELYREYKHLRQTLFDHLCRVHSNIPPLDHIRHTQKVLDRILFIAFAEARGLLPRRTLADAVDHRDKYQRQPIWQNLVVVFRWLNAGDAVQKIPAYNGGLFAPDSDLDEFEISDEVCRQLAGLSRFDFQDDVSVEVLGHIFEQSIADLEEMRAVASGEALPRVSKRKVEGVYYTPAYITRYILDRTLGRVLVEKRDAAWAVENPEAEKRKAARERKEIAAWERYRDALKETRVVDPACGSGAFLVAAFDLLVREYERVNVALASLRGGQVGLFDLSKTILNSNLFGVDLNEESVAITKLSLWLKTCARDSKLTYLDRNIKCGDSIVSDPNFDPRDERAPRAFDWTTGNLVRSFISPAVTAEDAEIDARWQHKFDVVVGNPPYVRQELLGKYKEYLQREYRSYHGAADLYLYFYEVGLRLLRENGRLGYISSGTFARSNFAQAFRKILPKEVRVEAFVDFGENQPFEGAEMVRPSIMILKKAEPTTSFRYLFLSGKIPESLEDAMDADGVDCPTTLLDKSEWAFQSDASAALFDRLMARGKPLGEVTGGAIRYGVKTGLNDAFIIDTETRDKLVKADPSCASMIKKMLRGEDLRPWYQEDEGRWLIFMRRGTDIHQFPSIKAYLERFKDSLEPKPIDWPSGRPWPGRKGGSYKWFEIQDSVDYALDFERPKLFWPNITKLPRFSWDAAGYFINDKGYILSTDDRAILAVLQSRVCWFVISRICTPLRLRAGLWQYQLFAQFIERLPIPEMTADERQRLAQLARHITEAAQKRYALHCKTRRRLHDLIPSGQTLNRKLTAWWQLDFQALRSELKKTYKQDIPVRDRDDWETVWSDRHGEHDKLTARIVEFETEMNALVYELFALGSSDVQLIEEETKYAYGEV